MDYKSTAEKIIDLRNADIELRDRLVQSGQLGEGYHTEMEALHKRNAKILNEIIDATGYPVSESLPPYYKFDVWRNEEFSFYAAPLLGDCGNVTDIPFLRNFVAKKTLGENVLEAIRSLEGRYYNSNSINN